jgi:hypothetical protein
LHCSQPRTSPESVPSRAPPRTPPLAHAEMRSRQVLAAEQLLLWIPHPHPPQSILPLVHVVRKHDIWPPAPPCTRHLQLLVAEGGGAFLQGINDWCAVVLQQKRLASQVEHGADQAHNHWGPRGLPVNLLLWCVSERDARGNSFKQHSFEFYNLALLVRYCQRHPFYGGVPRGNYQPSVLMFRPPRPQMMKRRWFERPHLGTCLPRAWQTLVKETYSMQQLHWYLMLEVPCVYRVWSSNEPVKADKKRPTPSMHLSWCFALPRNRAMFRAEQVRNPMTS